MCGSASLCAPAGGSSKHSRSSSVCPETFRGMCQSLHCFFGIALLVRPTAVWELTTDTFSKCPLETKYENIYTTRIWSIFGRCTSQKGGFEIITRVPVHILLHDIYFIDVRLNVCKTDEDFVNIESEWLFLQINCGGTKPEIFFNKQYLVKAYFERSVQNIYNKSDIAGIFLTEYMATRGFESSMTALLKEVRHADISTILHNGNSNVKTVSRYSNFHVAEGFRHEVYLFWTVFDKAVDQHSSK